MSDLISDWRVGQTLDKSQWLTPLPDGHLVRCGMEVHTVQRAVQTHFEHSQFPIMIEGETIEGGLSQRIFVVPPSWP